MSIDVKFSVGILLGVLIAVVWYEYRGRKMG